MKKTCGDLWAIKEALMTGYQNFSDAPAFAVALLKNANLIEDATKEVRQLAQDSEVIVAYEKAVDETKQKYFKQRQDLQILELPEDEFKVKQQELSEGIKKDMENLKAQHEEGVNKKKEIFEMEVEFEPAQIPADCIPKSSDKNPINLGIVQAVNLLDLIKY